MESPDGTNNWTFFDIFENIRSSPVYTTKQLNDNKYYKVVVTPNNLGGAGSPIQTSAVYFSSANQTTSIVLSQGYLDLIGTWHPLNGVTYSLQFYQSTDGSLGSPFGTVVSIGPLTDFVKSYTFLTPDPYDGKYYTAKITPSSGTLGISNTIMYTQLIVEPTPILRYSDSLGSSPGNTSVIGTTGSFPLYLTVSWTTEPQIQYLVQFFESQTGVTGTNDSILFQSFGSTGPSGTIVSPITTTIPCNDGKYYHAIITPANLESVGLPIDTGFISRFLTPLVKPTNFNMNTLNGVLNVYWDMFPGLSYDLEIWKVVPGNGTSGLTGGTYYNAVAPVVVNIPLVDSYVYYAIIIPKNVVLTGPRYSSISDLFALTSGFVSITYTIQPTPSLTQNSSNLRVQFSPVRSSPTDPTQYSTNYNINVYKNTTNGITGGTLAFNSPYNDPLQVIAINYGSYNLTGTCNSTTFSRYSSFTFTTNFTPSQCAYATNSYALVYSGVNSMFGVITSFVSNTLNFFSLTSAGSDSISNVLFNLQNQSQNTLTVEPTALTTLTSPQYPTTITMTNASMFTAVPILDAASSYPYPIYSGLTGSTIQITIDVPITEPIGLYLNQLFTLNSTILNSTNYPATNYNQYSANAFVGGVGLSISVDGILTDYSNGIASFLVKTASITQPHAITTTYSQSLVYAENWNITSNVTLLESGSYYYAQLDDGFGDISSSSSALQFLGPLTTPTNIVCSIVSGIPSVTWSSSVRGSAYKVEFYSQPSPVTGGYAGTLIQTTLNVSTYSIVCNIPITVGYYVYAVITPTNGVEYGLPVSSTQNVQFIYTLTPTISQSIAEVSVSWNSVPQLTYSVQFYYNTVNSTAGAATYGSVINSATSPTIITNILPNRYYYAVISYSGSISGSSTTTTRLAVSTVTNPVIAYSNNNLVVTFVPSPYASYTYSIQSYSGATPFGSAILNTSGTATITTPVTDPFLLYSAVLTISNTISSMTQGSNTLDIAPFRTVRVGVMGAGPSYAPLGQRFVFSRPDSIFSLYTYGSVTFYQNTVNSYSGATLYAVVTTSSQYYNATSYAGNTNVSYGNSDGYVNWNGKYHYAVISYSGLFTGTYTTLIAPTNNGGFITYTI
jgi:hypothetical protein